MRKLLHILYQPYKWLFFFPFLIINTLFFCIIAILLSFYSQKAAGYCGVIWARFNSFLTPISVKISGKENIQKNTSYIIVLNHQSYYDIFLIYGWLGIDIKWVMKQELRKIPGFGICCEMIGHIFIDRSNTQVAIESMNKVKQKLVNGTSVVIFPEGTRSKTGELAPFKRGAFRLALDLGLPILPITLIGTKDILPSDSMNLLPGKAQMIIHEPIFVNKYSEEEINTLISDVSKVISSALK
ncbi:MAG: lysophospholipid acyltransferase family protein [Bacteroidota bacterium]